MNITVMAEIAKVLIALAIERGLPCPFAEADVDEILSEDVGAAEKRRRINVIKNVVHEVICTPSRR